MVRFTEMLRIAWAMLRVLFPPKSKFSTEDMPDLTGRVVIVTGALYMLQPACNY